MATTKWLLTPPNGTAIRQQVIQASGAQAGQYAAANAIIIEFETGRKPEMLEWLALELTKFEHGEETPQAQHWKAAAEAALKQPAQAPSIPPEIAVMSQPAPPIAELPPEVRLAARAQSIPASRIPAAPVPESPGLPETAGEPAPQVIRVVPDTDDAPTEKTLAQQAIEFNPLKDPCPLCKGALKVTWAHGMVAIKCGTQGCLGVTPP